MAEIRSENRRSVTQIAVDCDRHSPQAVRV